MAEAQESIVRNPDVIRDTLRRACERSEIAILVTPHAKFDLNFLWMDQEVLHVTATMSKEDALYGLRSGGLRVRFPSGPRIFSAPTRLLGVGMARGRKSLRLSIPMELENDDVRRSYRVERVGRVQVTFSSRRFDLLTASLVNISTGGARIHAAREPEDGDLQVDDDIHVTIPLAPEITINALARVRHCKGRSIGLEFRPSLQGKLLEALARWAFQKREEALAQFAQAGEAPAGTVAAPEELDPEAPLLALVGGGAELEARLRSLLAGLAPFSHHPATAQTMRALAPLKRALVICALESGDRDLLRRLSVLLEPLRGRVPFVLLGEGMDPATLIALANDWEALLGTTLEREGGLPLQRLAQGMFGGRD